MSLVFCNANSATISNLVYVYFCIVGGVNTQKWNQNGQMENAYIALLEITNSS